MNNGNPWRISTLVSACYEFLLALFLLFQMVLALLALEVAKFLPVGPVSSCSRRRQHNAFCSGHFPPFSPCRQRDSGKITEIAGAPRNPTRFSRGLLPGRALSEDLSASRDASELTFPRRAGLANQSRSLSLTSAYKRKGRHNGTATVEGSPSECKGSVDGDTCQCIAAGLELYDDLIEVSSEYLKQKDRGHEEVILSLLKALQVERKNLRTLYEELEEERVAAETAANEAMAMILRLQEEKSALQMEADHYQRMAEEKALHDEHAIQLLEEDLCRKENERLLLEEELSELRRRSYDDYDVLDIAEKAPYHSVMTKPLFLLTGIDEACYQEEQEVETVIKSQDTAGLECVTAACTVSNEDYSEGLPSADQPLKRLKSFAQHGLISDLKDLQIAEEIVESALIEPNKHPEKLQPSYEDDAKAILVQLSAVEKQLLALEESEKLELWQQAQASRDSLINELLSADKSSGANLYVEDENISKLQTHENNASASATEALNMLDEERVVNVDVANVTDGPYCETYIPISEEIFEIQEGKRQRSKVVQWEASEEEKHLDLPSFIRRSNSSQSITSTLEGTCKPVLEEENWDAKRVTLEGINLRLQALESESTLLRHCSAPSNHEHVNLALLKEIMEELQELLKANRNVSAAKEAMSAFAKGDMQHKKRHYADGPGQFP